LGVEVLQALHMPKMKQASDFAGRTAVAAVRRNAHLANANKFGHIRRVNTMLGLFVPLLVTPLELLGEDHETEA
jgi:hypothetical protein